MHIVLHWINIIVFVDLIQEQKDDKKKIKILIILFARWEFVI